MRRSSLSVLWGRFLGRWGAVLLAALAGTALLVGCGAEAGGTLVTTVGSGTAGSGSAQTAARAAERDAVVARAAAGRVQTAWASAESAMARALALSALTSARIPTAPSPAGALAAARSSVAAIQAAVPGAQAALAQALHALATVQGATGSAPANVRDAVQAAQHAVATALAIQSEALAEEQQAQRAVSAWLQVHDGRPGYLGIVGINPTAGFGVGGCEIVTALPGTPAATAGLVGSTQRTDPVGDTIYRLIDMTDGHADWAIPDCQALTAAMAETRPGDLVQVDYYHRHVVWYLLSGVWEPKTVDVQLGQSACPPPLTAPIVNTRLRVTLQLTGPAGTAVVPAIIDTGGANGWFDAGLLNRLGFAPIPGSRFNASGYLGAPPGTVGYVYRIPFPAIDDRGRFVALGQGSTMVEGIVGLSSWEHGIGRAGIGPTQLTQVTLLDSGSTWSISWPGCGE